jgi:hypothetical protein
MGGACRWCFLAWSHRTNLLANSKGTQKDYPYEPQNILVADHFYVCRRGRCCSCRLRAKSGREVKRGFQCGLFSSLFPCCFPGNAARNGSSVLQRLRRSVRSGHEGRSRGDVRSRDDRTRGETCRRIEASRVILRFRALSSALSNILAAVTPDSRSRPKADPRARPRRWVARSKAGSAAGRLPPRGGWKERMKGSRPARMPVYGTGFRGRDPGLYAPQPPAIPVAPLQHPAIHVAGFRI